MKPSITEAYDKKKKMAVMSFLVFTENDVSNASFFFKSKFPELEVRTRLQKEA